MSQVLIVQSHLKFFRINLTEEHQSMLDRLRSASPDEGDAEWLGQFLIEADYPAKAWSEEPETWPDDNSLASPDEEWTNMLVPHECYTLFETETLPAAFGEPWTEFLEEKKRFPRHLERRKKLALRAFRRALIEAAERGDSDVEVSLDTSDIEGHALDWEQFSEYLKSSPF